MDRRQFIKTTGSITVVPHDALTTSIGEQSTLLPPHRSSLEHTARRAFPFSQLRLGYQQNLPTATPIAHTFAWTTVADEPPDVLDEILAVTEYEFSIDGHSIPAAETYWSDIYQKPDRQHGIKWVYVTPPRPEGQYSFSVTLEFSEPLVSQRRDGDTFRWSGSYEHHGQYHITNQRHSIHTPDS